MCNVETGIFQISRAPRVMIDLCFHSSVLFSQKFPAVHLSMASVTYGEFRHLNLLPNRLWKVKLLLWASLAKLEHFLICTISTSGAQWITVIAVLSCPSRRSLEGSLSIVLASCFLFVCLFCFGGFVFCLLVLAIGVKDCKQPVNALLVAYFVASWNWDVVVTKHWA